ncbi:high-affinity K+ transport system ATPase subunit B [Bradyrhizobium japonicum]
MSGRAVEAAGDVDTLLLDKTGTITLGNRQATAFRPVRGVTEQELADAAQLASLADETPEGRSIVVLAKEKYSIRSRDMAELGATFIPFTAQTRMSGVDAGGSSVRKGAVDAMLNYVGGGAPLAVASGNTARAIQPAVLSDVGREVQTIADEISKAGGTPLAVAKDGKAARRHPAQGYRQGRHPRALRRTAPHGHPHHHDHGRQPDDGRCDRGRSRRR